MHIMSEAQKLFHSLNRLWHLPIYIHVAKNYWMIRHADNYIISRKYID